MYSFSYLEPVCCSMSSSNCCFLTCIQVSQEAGQVVWYSHLLNNFPQFIVIHTVKGFGIVNKAETDVFSGTLLLFPWSSGCWQFDLWFLCGDYIDASWSTKVHSLHYDSLLMYIVLLTYLSIFISCECSANIIFVDILCNHTNVSWMKILKAGLLNPRLCAS